MVEIGKRCIGVELSPRRALSCANSLSRLREDSKAVAICGNGLDSKGVMSLVREKNGGCQDINVTC